MNAIELLVHDHETVKKLLNELSETTERALKKRSELLGRLELELVLHTAIEEDILYPAIRDSGGKEELKMYYEAKEEHRTVDSLVLPDLKRTRPDTVQFVATRSAAMPPATWSRASARRTCRASRRGGPRCGCSRTSTRSP